MTNERRDEAVVLGGSLAGLLAARVLADRFARVTVVERDVPGDGAAPRKGVPQARHGHGLLVRGRQILEQLFPGLGAALLADGATPVEMGQDLSWFHYGGFKQRFASGLEALMPSRPLLEAHVRRRVRALPNVVFREGGDAAGICFTGERVSGALVDFRTGRETLPATIVVDALGRGSPLPRWLEAAGFPAAPEESVEVDVTYTSRVHRIRAPLGFRMLLVSPTPPHERRLGGIFPLEDGRCMVTLVGWLGEKAPADNAGFAAFARSLPSPALADALEKLEPVEDAVTLRFPANRYRHYERAARLPAGLFAIGDAVCSFNPAFGQGMSTAALQALALGRAAGEGWTPRRYYREVAKIVAAPWSVAVGEDFRFPEVKGARPPGTAFLHWYIARVHRAARHDRVVAAAFLRVMNLLAPPPSLLAPAVALRVLWPRGGGAAARTIAAGAVSG